MLRESSHKRCGRDVSSSGWVENRVSAVLEGLCNLCTQRAHDRLTLLMTEAPEGHKVLLHTNATKMVAIATLIVVIADVSGPCLEYGPGWGWTHHANHASLFQFRWLRTISGQDIIASQGKTNLSRSLYAPNPTLPNHMITST